MHLTAGHKKETQFSCTATAHSSISQKKKDSVSARERIYIYIQFYDMNYCVESTFTVHNRTLELLGKDSM